MPVAAYYSTVPVSRNLSRAGFAKTCTDFSPPSGAQYTRPARPSKGGFALTFAGRGKLGRADAIATPSPSAPPAPRPWIPACAGMTRVGRPAPVKVLVGGRSPPLAPPLDTGLRRYDEGGAAPHPGPVSSTGQALPPRGKGCWLCQRSRGRAFPAPRIPPLDTGLRRSLRRAQGNRPPPRAYSRLTPQPCEPDQAEARQEDVRVRPRALSAGARLFRHRRGRLDDDDRRLRRRRGWPWGSAWPSAPALRVGTGVDGRHRRRRRDRRRSRLGRRGWGRRRDRRWRGDGRRRGDRRRLSAVGSGAGGIAGKVSVVPVDNVRAGDETGDLRRPSAPPGRGAPWRCFPPG